MIQQPQVRNIVYLSDRSGTGKWRRIFHANLIDCIQQDTGVSVDYMQMPIFDPKYYNGVSTVTIQRWINDQQLEVVEKFLKPLCDELGIWLIYEIDDLMSDKYIPKFNKGRQAFEGENVQNNIKKMLNMADFVTTTTQYLKDKYVELYDVDPSRIIALPNFLPKWWFGDRYEPDKKLSQFQKNKAKPRIGIISSLSHYNVDNVRVDKEGYAVREVAQNDGTTKWINEQNKEIKFEDTEVIKDDFDLIEDCIVSTLNDFQWVIFGFCPPELKKYVDSKKIEFHNGTAIINYPSMLENLKLQAVVSPIINTEFNLSKSFIKTMECAAIGVPLFASNCTPYDRVMDASQLFDTGEELKQKLLKLKFSSSHIYKEIIERQWNWLNSPCIEGDFQIRNFWLDDNIPILMNLFKPKVKYRTLSMNMVIENLNKNKSECIYNNNNGVEIYK